MPPESVPSRSNVDRMEDYRAQSECDGSFSCLAPTHTEGCFTGEGHPDAIPAEVAELVVTLRQQLQGAVDLIEQARDCVTAALNCTAHSWHGSDEARRWLMRADSFGGR